jgi:MHS family proline/betaine transporter-like MFS transporter
MSDRFGRIQMMIGVSALFAVSAYPMFALVVAYPSLATIIVIVCWLSILKAAYSGVLPSLMSELFPIATRSSGVAISYNVGVPIFGGFAPLIAAWLIRATGSPLAPSFYLIATSIISLVVLVIIRARVRTN